MLMVVIAKSRT